MIKKLYLIGLAITFIACQNEKSTTTKTYNPFQAILSNHNIEGNITILDIEKDQLLTNSTSSLLKGHLPASTFKIPLSIIALETKNVESASTVLKWDGKKRYSPLWERDLKLKEAFQVSCVPCYREIANKIGYKNIRKAVKKLDYGNLNFTKQNFNSFWLRGSSTITPLQQISFLQKLYNKELAIRETTHTQIKKILEIKKTNKYTLSGKTGWTIVDGINIGWFVGKLEYNSKEYYYSICIEKSGPVSVDEFVALRKTLLKSTFKKLNMDINI